MKSGQVVICAGGGGIPVIKKDNKLEGVAAVIDKDYAHIVTKVAGQDNGLYIVSISYLTINDKEYTVAVGA